MRRRRVLVRAPHPGARTIAGPAWRPGVAPRRIETGMGPVELALEGQGPAVLALHGGLGGFDQGLLLARAALGPAAPFTVAAVSRPGYLGTPLGVRAHPEAQAELYAATLDALGIDRALVLALSAGGPSALAFARHHRARCAGLILVSACTGRLDVPPRVRARLPMFRAAAAVPGAAALMGLLAASAPERAARPSIRDRDLRLGTLAHGEAGPLLRAFQEGIFARLAGRLAGTRSDVAQLAALPISAFEGVAAPTLAIHGMADRVVPFAHAVRVAQHLPQARIMGIPHGGHVCLVTHLDAVRAEVAGFLDGLGPW